MSEEHCLGYTVLLDVTQWNVTQCSALDKSSLTALTVPFPQNALSHQEQHSGHQKTYIETQAFPCDLYDLKGCKNVNHARALMFQSGRCTEMKSTNEQVHAGQTPSGKNFLAAIYRRCLESQPDIPLPVNHGWKLEGDRYTIDCK